MKPNRLYISLFIVINCFTSLVAQIDSVNSKNDTLNSTILISLIKKNAELQKSRIDDSIKTTQLQTQLNSLKTTDNLKKEELLKQLNAIKVKDSLRLVDKKAHIDSLRQTAKSFPVNGFFNDTLFLIYSKLGSFSAADRAQAIENRIKKIPLQLNFQPDSLKIVNAETTIDLILGDKIIMSITENDAIWNTTTKEQLAQLYKSKIVEEVLKYKNETKFTKILKDIGLSVLILLLLGIIIHYILRLFRWLNIKVDEQENKLIKGITINNYTLFDAKKQIKAIHVVNTFIKWVVLFVLVYFTLPIIFGLFPWTKNLAGTLLGYVISPLKDIAISLWNYLPNLITLIVIVIVFRYVLKAFRFFKEEIETNNLKITGFYPDWANPTFQIIRIITLAFMIIVIFPYLPGSDSKVFQGVSVFLGFLFTFGSAGSLSNVMAGLVLTYMRLFKIGDRVKIGEVFGDIIEKSILVTRIRTIKNEIISIPNSSVLNSHTINYSSDTVENGLIVHTTVTIGYDVPWKEMHQALITAAERTEFILKEPKPFVLQTSLDDFYVSYQINAYTKNANKQAIIYSHLHENIQDCCNESGIEIMSPHYRSARDGNKTTIPENYLEKDYKAPSFTVINKKE